jgi:hypothetical protein
VDEAAVIANRSAEFPPAIGSNAFVVVNLTCAGLRRSRHRARAGEVSVMSGAPSLFLGLS